VYRDHTAFVFTAKTGASVRCLKNWCLLFFSKNTWLTIIAVIVAMNTSSSSRQVFIWIYPHFLVLNQDFLYFED
jgi:hypothetical protein